MGTVYRRDAGTIAEALLPRVPDRWDEKSAKKWAMDLIRALDFGYSVVHRIQVNGIDMPLRARLDLEVTTVTVVDDPDNDRIVVTLP